MIAFSDLGSLGRCLGVVFQAPGLDGEPQPEQLTALFQSLLESEPATEEDLDVVRDVLLGHLVRRLHLELDVLTLVVGVPRLPPSLQRFVLGLQLGEAFFALCTANAADASPSRDVEVLKAVHSFAKVQRTIIAWVDQERMQKQES